MKGPWRALFKQGRLKSALQGQFKGPFGGPLKDKCGSWTLWSLTLVSLESLDTYVFGV